MPVVEKYGLMILFGLCALIVGVGIFAEDPLANEALAQKRSGVEAQGKSGQPAEEESVIFSDSDWAPGTPDGLRNEGLMSYSPSTDAEGMDPDPRRESSLGEIPRNHEEILEQGDEGDDEPTQVEAWRAPKLETRSYVVKKGDSLGLIASRQLGSTRYADEIRRVNPQIKNDRIYAGKTIQIPVLQDRGSQATKKPSKGGKARYIRVKKGDTLMAIAKREYGDKNKWKALARRNGIKRDTDLRDSQRLLIPADL